MSKNSPIGQKMWPTGREQTDRHRDRQIDRESEHAGLFFAKKNIVLDFLLQELFDKINLH